MHNFIQKDCFYGRNNKQTVSLPAYINMVKNVNKKEYNIALSKNKLVQHMNKWKELPIS